MSSYNLVSFLVSLAGGLWCCFGVYLYIKNRIWGHGVAASLGAVVLLLMALIVYKFPKTGDLRTTCVSTHYVWVSKMIDGTKYRTTEERCVRSIQEIYIDEKWYEVAQ